MSRNVEDRRGMGGGGFRMGGPMGIGGVIIALVLSLLFGGDVIGGGGGEPEPGPGGVTTQTSGGAVDQTPEERERAEFMSFVLDDAQTVWAQALPRLGTQYRDAKLVLFREATQSGCGFAQAGMGPFYCPLDEKVYIDLSFYDQLDRMGAAGDFAQAYVLAHEIGHHVQNVVGTAGQVRARQESRPNEANELSVRMELQADCFAGVWAASTRQRNLLDPGDVEEGMGAAAAVGDDRLQSQSTGMVRPETFTHGTSAQRVAWFRRGFQSGDPNSCDTFAGAR